MKKFNARGGQRVLNRPTPASRGGTRLQAGVRRQAEFDAKRSSTPSGVRRQAEVRRQEQARELASIQPVKG